MIKLSNTIIKYKYVWGVEDNIEEISFKLNKDGELVCKDSCLWSLWCDKHEMEDQDYKIINMIYDKYFRRVLATL